MSFKEKFFITCAVAGTSIGVVIAAKQWLEDETYLIKETLMGKTAVVTGADNGLGKEIAKQLAQKGSKVVLGCQHMEHCLKIEKKLRNVTHNRRIYCRHLDLADFASVRKFASELIADEKRLNSPGLNLLVLNAGVKLPKREITGSGIERMLAVNHLGHHLLARQLESIMAPKSRVIAVTCQEAYTVQLNWLDMNSEHNFHWSQTYGASKLANLLFIKEFAVRMADRDVLVLAFDPTLINTSLDRYMPWSTKFPSYILMKPIDFLLKRSAHQVAQSFLFCAMEPTLWHDNGMIFRNLQKLAMPSSATDADAKRMWLMSEKWTESTEPALKPSLQE